MANGSGKNEKGKQDYGSIAIWALKVIGIAILIYLGLKIEAEGFQGQVTLPIFGQIGYYRPLNRKWKHLREIEEK